MSSNNVVLFLLVKMKAVGFGQKYVLVISFWTVLAFDNNNDDPFKRYNERLKNNDDDMEIQSRQILPQQSLANPFDGKVSTKEKSGRKIIELNKVYHGL